MTGPMGQPPIAILTSGPCRWVEELLARCPAHIDLFADAWELRRALLGESQSVRRVLVGTAGPASPINAAAAYAKDGRALSVTLVVEEDTGSVRSRAFQAGISNVMVPEEVLASLVPEGGWSPIQPGGQMTGDPAGTNATPWQEPSSIAPSYPGARHLAAGSPSMAPPIGLAADSDNDSQATDESQQMGPKIVLVSGRGGVGKSAICALMAALAASWGLDVALVDLDLGFGNLFGYFGLDGPADLTRLGRCEGVTELGLCGKKAGERIVLFGPCAKPEYAETVAPKVTEMLDALALAHDLVIVDGGTSWGDGVAQSVQAADRLLVCSDERSGAVGTLGRVCSLAVRLGVARTRICQLVNRCDPRHRDEGFLARATEGFRAAQTVYVEDGGVEVSEILSVGRAVDLVNVQNPFTESVARNLGAMLSELGILPDDERALRAVGSRRPAGARRGSGADSRDDGRWAA